MKHLLGEKLTKLWRDRTGGILVYTAIAAPVLIGAAGLSVDIGLWYANKRLAQSAADSAALAGALEYRRSNGTTTSIEAVVDADALINGYSTANGVDIDVDDSVGPLVAVTITRTVPGLLSQVLFTGTTNVQARAVARADVNDSCIWALNPNDQGAVSVVGAADIDLGCGVIANSGDIDGLHQNGAGCLSATTLKVVGGSTADCMSPAPEIGITPFKDPLASIQDPAVGPCDFNGNDAVYNAGYGGPAITFNPGVYCGNGIRINTAWPVTFNPGLYILDGAPLTINGQAVVTGVDVSFYLTENNNGNNETIGIAGGADVTLSAPDDGPLPGILFYHDRDATNDINHSFAGGSDMQLEGVLYFPSSNIAFAGGSSLQSSAVAIIADNVSFSGNTYLGGFESSALLGNALLLQAKLVE
jgi:Flp pilus assembly protein TadG